ncbi:hypothetical protein JOD31_000737 [Methylopila capsulata]|uniref:Transglycosylase SLT domain-containing protein n=1 Tax=Methylopila capsulata TaxID=61654 RepID=A0A9W6IVE0_9HYPH|nr:lytic transglycosylase domain-containing protein [Methylopila capsulata]MBM7850525.1 hypothetical protein [Methylopila capsulata]GLK55821.1 hypothetical protein GCM10008170_18400 [Methylopila capsulata]
MELLSPSEAAGRVKAALKGAADATGAGFDYLLRTAQRESSLNPSAKAPTSSARGLFQFIDQTWLQVLKEDGPSLGLGAEAADVSKSASGRYVVADPTRKAELLALRDDPNAAALLAGAFTRRNAQTLTSELGRAPTEGELYVAHFLGARGAVDLVKLATATPNASAADAFPLQAGSNRAIFYDRGRERTASEVYARLTTGGSATATVAAAPATATAALALQQTADPTDYGPFRAENDGKAFHSLFQTGRRSPVAAYVSQTWSSLGAAGLASDAGGRTAAPSAATQQSVARAYAAPAPTAATTAAAVTTDVRPADVVATQAATKSRRRAVRAALAASAAAPLDLASFRTAVDSTPVGRAARSARK